LATVDGTKLAHLTARLPTRSTVAAAQLTSLAPTRHLAVAGAVTVDALARVAGGLQATVPALGSIVAAGLACGTLVPPQHGVGAAVDSGAIHTAALAGHVAATGILIWRDGTDGGLDPRPHVVRPRELGDDRARSVARAHHAHDADRPAVAAHHDGTAGVAAAHAAATVAVDHDHLTALAALERGDGERRKEPSPSAAVLRLAIAAGLGFAAHPARVQVFQDHGDGLDP